MIKTIKKFQIKLTPFDATKEWNMSTTNNQDLLLMDDSSSISDEPVALEFIDYGDISNSLPFDNSECDIALEQQPDDLITNRIGLNVSGLFYPELDPINADGTYQRVIFSQIKTMFYNQYYNPTKMWGMNNIDFDLSKTKRKISDQIRLFDTPQFIYGDQLVPNTITLINNSIDDVFSIIDDGNGNLIAGTNLFAKRQEIGNHINIFVSGSDNTCNIYFDFTPPKNPYALTASQVGLTEVAFLNWLDAPADGFVIERSMNDSGSSFSMLSSTTAGVTSSLDNTVQYGDTYWYRVYSFNSWGSSSYSNTASVTINSSSAILFQLDSTLPNICMRTPYSVSLSASHGLLPYTYSIISGSLPLGFTFNTQSGLIAGTSSVFYPPITTSFRAAATDSLFRTATASVNLISTFCGIWEPWQDYITGSDINNVTGGIGFSSPWTVKNDTTWQPQVVSAEDFQLYITGSDLNNTTGGSGFLGFFPPTSSNVNFNKGIGLLGFSSSWIIKNDTTWNPQVVSAEDFQLYITGSDLNNATGGLGFIGFYPPTSSNVDFNKGIGSPGFSSSWIIKNDTTWNPQVVSAEDFELYATTSDLNGLTGGLGFIGFYPPTSSNVNFNNGPSLGFSSSWVYINTTS